MKHLFTHVVISWYDKVTSSWSYSTLTHSSNQGDIDKPSIIKAEKEDGTVVKQTHYKINDVDYLGQKKTQYVSGQREQFDATLLDLVGVKKEVGENLGLAKNYILDPEISNVIVTIKLAQIMGGSYITEYSRVIINENGKEVVYLATKLIPGELHQDSETFARVKAEVILLAKEEGVELTEAALDLNVCYLLFKKRKGDFSELEVSEKEKDVTESASFPEGTFENKTVEQKLIDKVIQEGESVENFAVILPKECADTAIKKANVIFELKQLGEEARKRGSTPMEELRRRKEQVDNNNDNNNLHEGDDSGVF